MCMAYMVSQWVMLHWTRPEGNVYGLQGNLVPADYASSNMDRRRWYSLEGESSTVPVDHAPLNLAMFMAMVMACSSMLPVSAACSVQHGQRPMFMPYRVNHYLLRVMLLWTQPCSWPCSWFVVVCYLSVFHAPLNMARGQCSFLTEWITILCGSYSIEYSHAEGDANGLQAESILVIRAPLSTVRSDVHGLQSGSVPVDHAVLNKARRWCSWFTRWVSTHGSCCIEQG